MIDRYLLRYFLAVVEQGNFSKAATLANVSQPTLSVGIAKLERLLDRQLFVRTNRRVEVTEAGARFAEHARRIENEFALAEREVSGANMRRTFKLGVLSTVPSAWLAAFSMRFVEVEGDERLELIEGREGELLDGLARNRLDAALTLLRNDSEKFATELLLSEGYSLALPENHPLANQKAIAPEALADNPMIVRRHCEVLSETSRHFTNRGVRPFLAFRTTNDDRALALVQAGLGITVMPDGFTAQGVRRPRLVGFDFTRSIGILHAQHIDRASAHSGPTLSVLRETVGRFRDRQPKQT
jgi:DNA-binding transcriptional LysR family regulator